MNPFESLQVPRCALCGKEIRELSIISSSKYNGYICHECLEHELIDEMSENERMKVALKKIRDFAEFEATFYSKDLEKILEYAQEGLGEWEGDK